MKNTRAPTPFDTPPALKSGATTPFKQKSRSPILEGFYFYILISVNENVIRKMDLDIASIITSKRKKGVTQKEL
jgi:hypothetical protein